jgi:hypothetical protein
VCKSHALRSGHQLHQRCGHLQRDFSSSRYNISARSDNFNSSRHNISARSDNFSSSRHNISACSDYFSSSRHNISARSDNFNSSRHNISATQQHFGCLFYSSDVLQFSPQLYFRPASLSSSAV